MYIAEIKEAVYEVLKSKQLKANHGMLFNANANMKNVKILSENDIDIYFEKCYKTNNEKFYNVVVMNNNIIGFIKIRYSDKTHKMLKPLVEWRI